MKTLFQFLNEARVSQASQEAKKLNLTSDGHGSWRDSRGKLVAKTVAGKLKMLTAQERAAEEGGAERQKKPEQVKAQSKAAGDTTKIIDDENVIKDCVQTSKKLNGIKAYPSKTSKQNWHIDLTCRTHTTTLNFSIRTNKPGINHKLGQYVNLAVKFNGIAKTK